MRLTPDQREFVDGLADRFPDLTNDDARCAMLEYLVDSTGSFQPVRAMTMLNRYVEVAANYWEA